MPRAKESMLALLGRGNRESMCYWDAIMRAFSPEFYRAPKSLGCCTWCDNKYRRVELKSLSPIRSDFSPLPRPDRNSNTRARSPGYTPSRKDVVSPKKEFDISRIRQPDFLKNKQ